VEQWSYSLLPRQDSSIPVAALDGAIADADEYEEVEDAAAVAALR
jgi:hypothetical protein